MMTRPRSTLLATLLLPALSLSFACISPFGPDESGETIDRLPRALTGDEILMIERSNAFGIDLLREVVAREEVDNVTLSPLSASMALGMTLNGTAGSTFDGMRETLGFTALDQPAINDAYLGLLDLLVDLDPSVEVAIANAAWANQDYPFHQSFFEAIVAHFDAVGRTRDFTDPSTLDEINGWVVEKTEGHIESILEEGQLDPALALLLLNALYFEADWVFSFDAEKTTPAPFTRNDGTTVTVQMMEMEDPEMPFARVDGLSVVELPYGGGAYVMDVVVPTGTESAREVAMRLTGADWNALVDALQEQELSRLALPRFTFESDVILNDALTEMGMGEAFTTEADFSNLSPERMCIDFVRQKTFIEVDEAGTRAAAVTAVGLGPTSAPPSFVANRPFLFAIRERLSETILFVGLVGDPTVADAPTAELPEPCRNR